MLILILLKIVFNIPYMKKSAESKLDYVITTKRFIIQIVTVSAFGFLQSRLPVMRVISNFI